jgi:hypothetical protein
MNNSNPEWGPVFRLAAPLGFAVLGIALGVNIRPSIQASLKVIQSWHEKQQEIIEAHEALAVYNVNASPGITEDSVSTHRSRRYALNTLTIMTVAWIILGGVAVAMYLLGRG